jgi:hypothetical protein
VSDAPRSFTPGESPECMACPIGLAFFAVREIRPEAMEHLMKAGFELFQAFKIFTDAAAERWDKQKPGGLEHIPIS